MEEQLQNPNHSYQDTTHYISGNHGFEGSGEGYHP